MHALIHTYIIIIIKGPSSLYKESPLSKLVFQKENKKSDLSKTEAFSVEFCQTFLTALFLTLDATGMGLNNSAW